MAHGCSSTPFGAVALNSTATPRGRREAGGLRPPNIGSASAPRSFAIAHKFPELIEDDPEGFLLPRAMIEDILARDEIFLEMAP